MAAVLTRLGGGEAPTVICMMPVQDNVWFMPLYYLSVKAN